MRSQVFYKEEPADTGERQNRSPDPPAKLPITWLGRIFCRRRSCIHKCLSKLLETLSIITYSETVPLQQSFSPVLRFKVYCELVDFKDAHYLKTDPKSS